MADTLRLYVQMQTLRTRGAPFIRSGALRCAFLFPLFPLPYGEWEHAKSLIYKDVPTVPTVPTQKYDKARRRGEIRLKSGGGRHLVAGAMYPHFSKKYPHLYPHIPPDACALMRTYTH